MGLNPEREPSMNVVNNPLMGFEEFEAYQPRSIEPLRSFSPWSQGSGSSLPDIVKSIANTDTQRERGGDSDFSRFFPASSRMFAQPPGNGKAHSPRYRFHPAQAQQNGASTTRMSLDARSLQKSSQSTSLTIQTRDGDTVTVQIRERSVQKESSQVNISKGADSDGVETEVGSRSKSDSADAYDLSAMLGKDTVSDVSYERQWVEASRESVDLKHSADGVNTDASYRSNTYTAGALEFEVDGSLDADELKAIGDLLQGVDELSETFFEGDVAAAFDQALQLGYDKTEIAGYSLELKEREFSYAEKRYRAAGEINQPEIPKGLFRPIGNYLDRLNALSEKDRAAFDGQLLEKLMQRVDENREAEESEKRSKSSFTAFNFELLSQYESLQMLLGA